MGGFTTCATPAIINGVDTAFCVGNTYQLRSSIAPEYQWFNSGNKISNAISQSLTVNSSGNYQVRTTTNNCQALSIPIKIVVNQLPLPPNIRDTFYCNNIKVDALKASTLANHSLIWYTSDSIGRVGTNIPIVPNTNNIGVINYFVSQTNNLTKCESPLAKYSITINPIPNSPVVKDSSYYKFISTKADGFIYHMQTTTLLGRTPSDIVEYLKNPLNEEILVNITKKVEGYWNQ